MQDGAIRVPDFQRPLRWGSDDVVKLFDSILKGYPIGSLLFWKRRFEEQEIVVGTARIKAGALDDGWFIVDEPLLDAFTKVSGHAWVKEEILAGITRARDAFVDFPVPARMHAGLEEHWRRVPLLKKVGSLPAR